MNIITGYLIGGVIAIGGYAIPNKITVSLPVKVSEKTLDSELIRLSEKYQVSESAVRAIIKCESELYGSAVNHNIDKDGKVWSSDYGYLQINDYYHKARMDKLGLNIYDQWDSLEYGFMLINESGFSAWSASKKCWLQKIK